MSEENQTKKRILSASEVVLMVLQIPSKKKRIMELVQLLHNAESANLNQDADIYYAALMVETKGRHYEDYC